MSDKLDSLLGSSDKLIHMRSDKLRLDTQSRMRPADNLSDKTHQFGKQSGKLPDRSADKMLLSDKSSDKFDTALLDNSHSSADRTSDKFGTELLGSSDN